MCLYLPTGASLKSAVDPLNDITFLYISIYHCRCLLSFYYHTKRKGVTIDWYMHVRVCVSGGGGRLCCVRLLFVNQIILYMNSNFQINLHIRVCMYLYTIYIQWIAVCNHVPILHGPVPKHSAQSICVWNNINIKFVT